MFLRSRWPISVQQLRLRHVLTEFNGSSGIPASKWHKYISKTPESTFIECKTYYLVRIDYILIQIRLLLTPRADRNRECTILARRFFNISPMTSRGNTLVEAKNSSAAYSAEYNKSDDRPVRKSSITKKRTDDPGRLNIEKIENTYMKVQTQFGAFSTVGNMFFFKFPTEV